MTFKELKEFFDITLNKEKWEVPIVRLFTQDEVMAILSDIQLEVKGLSTFQQWPDSEKLINLNSTIEIIQEKINALKAESEDT